MKFRIERDTLADAVAWTARSLPVRPSVPVLAGLLIEAGTDGLTLSGFDYETSTRATLPAEVSADGRALVSGRLLSEIVKSLPGKPVDVELEGTKVRVECGSARFSLQTMPVEEYPSLPEVDGPSGMLPGEDFSDTVGQVAVAASRDDVTPVITGVQLEIVENRLSLVATDRYRVAVREIDWESTAVEGGVTALVPSRTLSEIGKIFAHSTAVTVTILGGSLGQGHPAPLFPLLGRGFHGLPVLRRDDFCE